MLMRSELKSHMTLINDNDTLKKTWNFVISTIYNYLNHSSSTLYIMNVGCIVYGAIRLFISCGPNVVDCGDCSGAFCAYVQFLHR